MGATKINQPRLLITEDDYENRKFLEMYLKRYFDVDVCDSSDTFYYHIDKNNYDLILMDISIRGSKNGLDLTKELKNNPDRRDIPIICYTAHAFNKDRLNALDAGCDAYISKPSDVRTLLTTLVEMLKMKGKDYLVKNTIPELLYS